MIKGFPQVLVTYMGQTVPKVWRWQVVFVPHGQPLDIQALQKTVKKVTKKYCKKPDLLMATFNAGHELQVTALKNDVCKIYGTAIDIGTSGVTTLPIDRTGNVSSADNYLVWSQPTTSASVFLNNHEFSEPGFESAAIAKAASVNKNFVVTSAIQNDQPNLAVNYIDLQNLFPEGMFITAEALRDKLLSVPQAIYQLDGEKLFVDCIFVGYLAVYGFPGEKEKAYLKQAGVIRDVNNNQNNFPIPLIGLLSDVAIERLALYKKIHAE